MNVKAVMLCLGERHKLMTIPEPQHQDLARFLSSHHHLSWLHDIQTKSFYQVKMQQRFMRRSIRNINIPPPPPPRANPGHLNVFFARGVGNLIWKAIPGVGNLTLPGWGGKFEPKVWISKYLFWPAPIKRRWLFQNMEPFKGKIYRYRFCE